ncbi:sensor histidine kinase [Marinicrinis lubricantis]|uniref:histidine kinase n=1 Tax=Marinicrinis lubricantis TaxID=2086470 RepID=A0ABW1INJ0_9BACL
MVWKLIFVNVIVIVVVIWLTGVSVKDFACFLVNQYSIVNKENGELFNETMHFYLLRASITASIVAAFIHYFFIRKILSPLQALTKSARQMTSGIYPNPLKVTNDELGQLSQDFNQMISTLKQAEESRKNMLGDISHELRTPLSNLNGYLEALSSGVIDGDKALYRSLHEEAKHLIRLVDQLHQLTSWETKRLNSSVREKIAIDKVINNSVQLFELEFFNKNIEVLVETEPAVLMGDEIGLKQVLDNLLHNAIRYNRGNFIKLEGRKVNGDHLYRVTVTNKGDFIPSDKVSHIFERLYRIDPARQRATGGSGLGLAIVKEIITQHGGQVGLDSDGGLHSFWFTLPIDS